MSMVTVASLRRSGFKVRVLHTRNYLPSGSTSCKGGSTTVEITTPDGNDISGTAKCRDDERFDRKIGLSIAIGRAFSSLKKPTCRPEWFNSRGGPCGLARKD